MKNSTLNPLLYKEPLNFFFIALSGILMYIDHFLKMEVLVGAWHIVSYLLLLAPMLWLLYSKQVKNPYSKYLVPLLFLMIIDMFYYSNELLQIVVPLLFYALVILWYLTAMHDVHALYQTFIPRFALPFRGFGLGYVREFITLSFVHDTDKKFNKQLYLRLGFALMITLPFLAIFVFLLSGADSQYSQVIAQFISQLFSFNLDFSIEYFITIPLYFLGYLGFLLYTLSNVKVRTHIEESKRLDLLIVGFFLGMINLLFLSFVLMQIPFLLNDTSIPRGISIADFAREGFFQLMMVMGLVLLIFLFIMRRFHGEKLIAIGLLGLLSQTVIMGITSLKKMYLYQSIKGATILRYYVEWFDYFLIIILLLGILFLVQKYTFSKLLDLISITAIFAFAIVISLNIDAMVAKHNIEKFKDTPNALDYHLLNQLSIDALPIFKEHNIKLKAKTAKRDCQSFSRYHLGYCLRLKLYGENHDN